MVATYENPSPSQCHVTSLIDLSLEIGTLDSVI